MEVVLKSDVENAVKTGVIIARELRGKKRRFSSCFTHQNTPTFFTQISRNSHASFHGTFHVTLQHHLHQSFHHSSHHCRP
jgi:hypothetical protein